ncbi:C-type lectin receptor-like tyrosine-protein kinase At1g52310 isoform X2 [Physcomitrium patens]|uniref:C-type lectin receptor-like tyrosine-protein kinase At1g52310 isoform X2 n=1 Tax=Physcomitrium patens TaxID=3218 RepID=UPI000D176F4F|nr:C-type lectin receptor-like tyrosine-protein kinase At1g52310 isoform X2 [Physcomitrium patens]|eukprot:XP_024395608.1 C-type lectin receptor-like tyrosine-protein kinase At1g52310 isoform X2 [Physcomitrella patens]
MKACLSGTGRVQYLLLACCFFYCVADSRCACPPGWLTGSNETVCFSLMKNHSSWSESESACKANGGYLASLNSLDEFYFVQAVCGASAADGCWVGGQELPQDQNSVIQWKWSDCDTSHYIDLPWVPSPSNSSCMAPICPDPATPRLCTVVTRAGVKWDLCSSSHSFLCAIGQESECKDPKSSHREYTIILISVCTILAVTTTAIVAFLLAYRRSKRRRRSRRRKLAELSSSSGLLRPAFRLYTIRELEVMTEYFSEANLLGSRQKENGGVYRGTLADGTTVAVKRLQRTPLQSQKEFVYDVLRIARLKQLNLVAVRGCAYENRQGYIVYEFFPNGSLDQWLHNKSSEAQALDWGQRIRIATTLAQGLAYLHDTLKPHVVHRDVRASNVLLDEHFDAHILGVGLSRLVLREATVGHTVIAGTYGYLAPEFVYRNELTTKSDVYSYGVLLLELITGRKPTVDGAEPSDWQSTFEWATPLVQAQRFLELLDPTIQTIPDVAQIQCCVDLVYACTQHVPASRPRMSYVVHQLMQLRQGLVPLPLSRAQNPPPRSPVNRVEYMNIVNQGDNTSLIEIENSDVPF